MMKIKILCTVLSLLAAMIPLTVAVTAEEREETELLASAIESAASGESYTVMVSLAAVLVNRVGSEAYPSSLAAVISDAGIDISSAIPSARARRAALDAIGGFDPTSGALLYTREAKNDLTALIETDGWSFY